jgi:cell fate regulator YaaT (PSP1 superfamily)
VVRHPIVEVKFKGTRKEYYKNPFGIDLEIGDAVTVESQTSGWDVGYVSLTGDLVMLQMKKNRIDESSEAVRKVLRKSNEMDLERYEEGKNLEYETMLHARRIAYGIGLVMKISDVEYQGDRTKATFFYTAEGRVDFRELIKQMAREFKIKIEMRQIGLRQEAGRLGGIGSCGRELCCSTWLTDFHSVPTTAARYQNLFLNPLKLSGQCGRLKCCLNYELDVYVEALNEFPEDNTILKTEKGLARVEKLDILKRIMWFRYEGDHGGKFFALEVDKVKSIIEMNEQGVSPVDLEEYLVEEEEPEEKELEFKDTVGEERLDRFDRTKRSKKKKNNNNNRSGETGQSQRTENRPAGQQQPGGQQQPRPERRDNNNNRPPREDRPRDERQPRDNNNNRNQQNRPQGGEPGAARQPRDNNNPNNNNRGGRENRPEGQRPQGNNPQRQQNPNQNRGPRPERPEGENPASEQGQSPRNNERPPRNNERQPGNNNRNRDNRGNGNRNPNEPRQPRPGIHGGGDSGEGGGQQNNEKGNPAKDGE